MSPEFRRGVLTLVGVLAGFTVTLMFFTGKDGKTDSLEYEQLQDYREQIMFLLWSQFKTLVVFICVAAGTISWDVSISWPPNPVPDMYLRDLYFGFVAIALLRSIIVPLQVIELHQMNLALTLSAREKAIRDGIEDERKFRVIDGQG